MDPRAVCVFVIFVFLVIFYWLFIAGDDNAPVLPPVKPKENLCKQHEEPYNKSYLIPNNLDRLRLNDNYTDIELISHNQSLRAHKVILAAHSQYFDSSIWMKTEERFVNRNETNNITQMNMEFIDHKTLVSILNFMYTNSLPNDIFNNETEYSNLLRAAAELQMETLKCETSKRLSIRINTRSVGLIELLAEQTETRSLMIIASKYLLDNFKNVSKTSEWQTIVKDNKNILADAIDFYGKLPDDFICDIQCVPSLVTSPSVFTRLRRTFLAQRFADAKIHVHNRIGNKVFQVNRAVLIGQSVAFQKQFATSPDLITVEDIRPVVMEEFLIYMYSGWPTNKMKTMAEELLYLSDIYGMTELQKACEDILIGALNIENAAKTIIIADKGNAKRLFSVTLDFILKHRKEVVATKGWTELKDKHPEILTKIFSN